jgi:hypothetical protein
VDVRDPDFGPKWRALRLEQADRRAANRVKSTEHLRDEGLAFTSHNGGSHLIVAKRWDFWPGTGLWRERKPAKGCKAREGRGVFELIALIRGQGDLFEE